ncbi:MAG: hypothetical protein QY332_15005 [Anaerolineales bacterium]|nr:MAG: hypothetical protein QY332_15005 [Anaerolineales bacterium]
MKNFREIEHLSAYVDGQLNTSELAQIESRLHSDPELASVLNDLRAARGILRKLPSRRAPRNFTLTRRMVGQKPPLPRTYPVFRFATVFATLLLTLSLTVNAMSPYISFEAPVYGAYGFGGGGPGIGGGCEEPCGSGGPAAEESAAEAPSSEMAPQAAQEDTAREGEPSPDTMLAPKEAGSETELQDQPQVRREAPFPIAWQIGFLIVGILSGAWMWFMRQSAARKWR